MDIKKLLFLSLVITFLSCGCNDDDLVTFRLTEEGQAFVQVEESTSPQYIDENDATFLANIEPIRMGIIENGVDDQCAKYLTESISYNMEIESINISINTYVRSLRNSFFSVRMTKQNGGINLYMNCEERFLVFTVDIYEIDNFIFENVYVFNACIVDAVDGVEQIVYTPEKGIEFIKFEDGGYLRLVD